MEETLESTIHNVSVVESPEFEIVNPRMKEIVKKAMNNRAKKAAMNSLNRSGRSNSSFVLRQASAIQLKNKAIIKELAKARAFNTQLENAVKRFRDQHLVLAMRLASAERKLKQMIEKDAAKQNFILLCKENLTSMVKAFENVEVDVECSPLESFHTASLERRPQRVLQSVTYPRVLDNSRIIKRNCEQKSSKSNVSDITENSDETDSTDDEEDKMSHCDDDDGLEEGIAEKNQAEQNTSICHNDSKETISDEIARPDEESPVELDLNVSFSSESSFSSLRHADFRKKNIADTQDNDEEEVDSIANRTVMEVNEAKDSAIEEHDVDLEKPQKQVENPTQSEITERKENNNSSEGATKPDTLSKLKKKNRSSVKRKKSSKVVQQAKSNNSAYDLHSVSDDSFILDPNKAIKLTTKNGSHVENDSQSKINGRKLTHVETMEEMEIVPQEHSELNENSARTKKSRLSVKNLTNIRSTTSDSFLLEPSRGGKVASTTKSQARSRSHGQNELNDENEEPVGRFRQRRKAPVSYLEPSLRKKLRREDPPAKHFQVLESLQN